MLEQHRKIESCIWYHIIEITLCYAYMFFICIYVCVWDVCERLLVLYSLARSYNDMKIIGMYRTRVVGQTICVMMFGMLNIHNHMDHPSAEVTIMYMLVTRLHRWQKIRILESWRCIGSDISSKGREVIQTKHKSQTSTNVLRVKCDVLWLLSEFMVHHIGGTYHRLLDFSICFLSPFGNLSLQYQGAPFLPDFQGGCPGGGHDRYLFNWEGRYDCAPWPDSPNLGCPM